MNENATEEGKTQEVKGLVYQSLQRNNKQIRADRAEALGEDLEIASRRQCEDLWSDLRKAKRERDAMYDLSPTNAQSLVLAKDVDGREIAQKDMEISLKIRELEIQYDIAKARYNTLYGKDFQEN